MEVLESLDFDLQFPTSFQFMDMTLCHLQTMLPVPDKYRVFCQFVLEVALLEG